MIHTALACVAIGGTVVYTWAGWRIHDPASAAWCAWHLPSLRRMHLMRLWSFAWPNLVLWGAMLWLLGIRQ